MKEEGDNWRRVILTWDVCVCVFVCPAAEGESLTNGELETFLQDVTKMVLQEMLVAEETTPEELMQ